MTIEFVTALLLGIVILAVASVLVVLIAEYVSVPETTAPRHREI